MKFKSIIYISFILLPHSFSNLFALEIDTAFMKYRHHPLVDSVFNLLSPDQRIGQLIWIKADSNHDIARNVWMSNAIKESGVGGIILSGGRTEKQTEMLEYFQKITRVPIIISQNDEWSQGMRSGSTIRFPDRMTLGAIRNDSMIYKTGIVSAEQFKRAGVHIVFDPVADLNIDQHGTIVSSGTFGENPGNAGRKTMMYMNGLQDNGIIPAAGYFTGTVNDEPEYQLREGCREISSVSGILITDCSEDPAHIIKEISESIGKGMVSRDAIDESCRKVLAAKYLAGLFSSESAGRKKLNYDLSPVSVKAFIRDLYANALTVLRNENEILPVNNLDKTRIASVSVNSNKTTLFQYRISKYQASDNYFIDPADAKAAEDLLKRLSGYDLVIAGIYGTTGNPEPGFEITPRMTQFLDKLIGNNRTIIVWFGSPYAIDSIRSLKESEGLVLAYQQNEFTEDLSAQLIFGGIGSSGRLPVTINESWPYDSGILIPGNIRIQYGFPENAGILSTLLEEKIDSVVEKGLNAKAFPGCEVMIARKGTVVFHKTYGYHTYDNRIAVMEDDLYDLASVTKISSTLAGLMLLDSEEKFSPDETLGNYIPFYRHSNKKDLAMSDILTHQAGLTSWIPFWKETVKVNGEFRRNIFSCKYSDRYPLKVAQSFFINVRYRKKIFKEIRKSPLGEKKYLYSDLAFIISPEIIEKLTGERWYEYVTANIYDKLGARDICFNPWMKYPLSRIVPTEYDSLFRKQQLHGTVHDEGAAMLGGISGHAGLFATANDLMKLTEMYRRMGSYGGEQIIRNDVLQEYTRAQYPENDNRRGLGFDKPLLNNSQLPQKNAYPAKSASPSSFGHSGYTGTFIWIDPEYEISYIFLSNRVYPTRENNRLSELNIRSDILQAIYDSIIR